MNANVCNLAFYSKDGRYQYPARNRKQIVLPFVVMVYAYCKMYWYEYLRCR